MTNPTTNEATMTSTKRVPYLALTPGDVLDSPDGGRLVLDVEREGQWVSVTYRDQPGNVTTVDRPANQMVTLLAWE